MDFLPFLGNGVLNFIMNSRNMKKQANLKIFKVVKFTSITRFSHYLLSITFNEHLLTPQLQGTFWSSCCFDFNFKSRTYNYLVNGQRALISPKLRTLTIILK